MNPVLGALLSAAALGPAVLVATAEGTPRAATAGTTVVAALRRARARVATALRAPRSPAPADVPLVLDLVAAAVRAGAPPGRAFGAAVDALAATGTEEAALRRVALQLSWGSAPEDVWRGLTAETDRWDELAEALLLSVRTGAPAASLLTSAAASARAARRWEAEAAAGRLSALLVLPLGLCTLPAFLLLGVVPVVLTLAGQLLGTGP